MAIRRTIKRLSAILTCLAGIPLLLIGGVVNDPVIRALTAIAGICLIASGGMQLWSMRRRKRTADDLPY
ncbi:MAG TPA: hypothetical protein VN718_01220 [Rhizomicrobium sp.]|nr:hypothetical protein [Rhizomicrobium sp.]